MTKETGLGWTTFSVDDSGGTPVALVASTTQLSFSTPRGVMDTTGLSQSAMDRLLLLADFSVSPTMVFDDGATGCHTVFKTVPSTSVARTVTITVSANTLPNETLFTDYALSRSQSGELICTAPGVLTGGTVPTWA